MNIYLELPGFEGSQDRDRSHIVNPVRGARVSYCGICTPHWVPSGRPKLTTNAQETMDEEFMQA